MMQVVWFCMTCGDEFDPGVTCSCVNDSDAPDADLAGILLSAMESWGVYMGKFDDLLPYPSNFFLMTGPRGIALHGRRESCAAALTSAHETALAL